MLLIFELFLIIFRVSFRLFLKKKRSKNKLSLLKKFKRENVVRLKFNKTYDQFKNNITIRTSLYTNLHKIFFFFHF